MELHTPCLTRHRLMDLSGSPSFRLPAAAKGRTREIAALSYEQVRYFERHGCFDDYLLRFGPRTDFVWKPRPLGATALYTLLDLAIARLCAWMLQEGVPHKVIVEVLRGQPSGRVTIAAPNADHVLVVDETAWMIPEGKGADDIAAMYATFGRPLTPENTKRFPIAWLGITEKFVSGLQKELERSTVPLWNRHLTPAEALTLQEKRAAL